MLSKFKWRTDGDSWFGEDTLYLINVPIVNPDSLSLNMGYKKMESAPGGQITFGEQFWLDSLGKLNYIFFESCDMGEPKKEVEQFDLRDGFVTVKFRIVEWELILEQEIEKSMFKSLVYKVLVWNENRIILVK